MARSIRMRSLWLGVTATAALGALTVTAQQKPAAPAATQQKPAGTTGTTGSTDPQQVVNAAYKQFQTLKEGKNADYIPALAKVDPNLFGIALITVDGKVFTAGDVKTEVSIQSISKVLTMAQVIQ